MKEDYSWVKLYRKIKYWQYYGDVYVKAVFLHLIIEADHETKMINKIKIERGSTLTSVSALCLGLQMSPKAVKRALKLLAESGDIIDDVKPNKFRIITVKNYNKYQSVGSQGTNKGTNKGTTNNKDNISTDILSEKKKCVCLTDTHTQQENNAAAPGALEERGHAAVTWNEIRQYQIDNHIGGGEVVDDFYDAFHESNTRFPENWQQVYTRFARADYPEQDEFVRRLKSGDYHSKWGKVDAGA